MKMSTYHIVINENATQNLVNSKTNEIVLESATSDEIDIFIHSQYFVKPTLLNRLRLIFTKS